MRSAAIQARLKHPLRANGKGIDSKQCTTLAFATAALLGVLVVLLGAISGGWLITVGIVVFALLISSGYFWIRNCQPTKCGLLRTLVAGVGSGATVLAILTLFEYPHHSLSPSLP